MHTDDIIRELDKAIDIVALADEHFANEAKMNAALHMSAEVRPAPLASAITLTHANLKNLRERLSDEN